MNRKNILLILTLSVIILSGCSKKQTDSLSQKLPVSKMIAEMLKGRETLTPIQPLSAKYGDFSMDEAYLIQDELAKALEKSLGTLTGYKVAYASKAAREQFGISEPASGPLFRLQQVPDNSALKTTDFIGLLIETEVAFTIGKAIRQPLNSVEELKPFVQWVHPAFDLSDDRYDASEKKPGVADMIAAGTHAHYFVLGQAYNPNEIEIDSLDLKLIVNEKLERESPATEVLGSPWNSLLFLANQLVARGHSLKPGDVILTGTAAPAYKAKGAEAAGYYLGDCGPLGQVKLTIH
ncbi:fumarylacetoacetate hydrolase family protein [candidate division KSB1 bacterium]|nr:fumarylacetoacetate hydrolase family protein [candidate division KSB1 bacterium]